MADRAARAMPRTDDRARGVKVAIAAAAALRRTGLYAALTAVGLLMVLPFLWMVTASIKTGPEIAARPIVWLPRQLYTGAYADLTANVDLGRVFFNSTFVTLAITLGILATSSLSGYALAKIQFPGREAFFVFTLSTKMVPFFVLVIPVFYITRQLGWLDSYQGLVVPNVVSGFGIFLMRQYMLTIPDELLDAARIDGAGEFGIFGKIALPLTKPALSALGVFSFMFHWDSFLWPLLIVHRPEMRTIPVALSSLQTFAGAIENMNIIMAGTTLAVLPVLVIFLLAQRQFIEGITLSGLKG
jgi:multiple sugar transport system permease protein